MDPETTPARRTALILGALLLISSLAGCFELQQEIWVGTDGGGRLRFTIRAAAPEGVRADTTSVPVVEIHEIARRLRRDTRLRFSPRVEQYVLAGDDHVALEIALNDWHDLPAINRDILELGSAGDPVRMALARLFDFSLEEDAEGYILYRQLASESTARHAGDALAGLETGSGDSGKARGLRIVLHSPTISRTTGAWQLDKSGVRWSVDLDDLMTGQRRFRAFEADIGAVARGPRFWRVIGIVLVISMLVGILTWFRYARWLRKPADEIR